MGGAQSAAGARLGALMREHRRAAGLTQRQLAQRSGLSVAAVRDLEQGRSRRPRRGSLDALARALGLDARQLGTLAAAGEAARPVAGGAPAGHGSGLWLAVLGPLTAWRDGLSIGLGQAGQAAVVGLLAVQSGELVRRETVIDALWGQQPPATAAELVQAHVSRLRRVLDPAGRGGLLEQGPAGYRLRAGPGEMDAAAFAELAEQAGAAAAAGDAAAACGLYAQALGLWRGEPAADVPVLRGHPAVTGLARRRTEAVLGYADAACRLSWHQRVLRLLEALAEEQPPDTAGFTGRGTELDRITAVAAQAAGSGGVVAICAIGGMPGVGKTALAVHASHLLKDRFPDRQLFVSLHGHTPGQDPLTPHAALAGLLAAVGVDARYLPGDLAGRAALWRDRMAGQKVLLVLDNAASTAQVAPLLPASAGCLVLVTGRRHLGDLPGAAAPVQLPVLTADEAREMFVRLAPRAARPGRGRRGTGGAGRVLAAGGLAAGPGLCPAPVLDAGRPGRRDPGGHARPDRRTRQRGRRVRVVLPAPASWPAAVLPPPGFASGHRACLMICVSGGR